MRELRANFTAVIILPYIRIANPDVVDLKLTKCPYQIHLNKTGNKYIRKLTHTTKSLYTLLILLQLFTCHLTFYKSHFLPVLIFLCCLLALQPAKPSVQACRFLRKDRNQGGGKHTCPQTQGRGVLIQWPRPLGPAAAGRTGIPC